jgi:two-component system, response regulator YesN
LYYPALKRVDEFVHQHPSQQIRLADAARVACMERKYFSAFFREKTAVRFREWIALIRIERAMNLMRGQDQPVTRIGLAVGYKDVRTFERAFKRLTGTTPRDFRASIRPDHDA